MKGMEDSLAFAAHESQLFPPSPLEQVPVPLQWRHSTAIKPPKDLPPASYPAESQALSLFYPFPLTRCRSDGSKRVAASLELRDESFFLLPLSPVDTTNRFPLSS